MYAGVVDLAPQVGVGVVHRQFGDEHPASAYSHNSPQNNQDTVHALRTLTSVQRPSFCFYSKVFQ